MNGWGCGIMVKIAFFELEKWEQEHVLAQMKQTEHRFVNPLQVEFCDSQLTIENADNYADCDVVSVFIFSKIDAALLGKLKAVKHINTQSTGYDHIDLKACAERGITVSNVPSYGENTVAEHAFALILALSRKIVSSVAHTRRGGFDTGPQFRGFDLKGKTLGVIGTGKIGKHVIRMAKGFEMEVIAYDAFPDENAAKEIGYSYVGLDELLGNSDVITLHAPLLPQTTHMINAKNITKVKRGAVLINTARGGLVETKAILAGIDSGILSAAGLDVLEGENDLKDEKQLLHKDFANVDIKTMLEEHILAEYDNVIITPHNAFNSSEALRRILDTSCENIDAFVQRKPLNLVKPA